MKKNLKLKIEERVQADGITGLIDAGIKFIKNRIILSQSTILKKTNRGFIGRTNFSAGNFTIRPRSSKRIYIRNLQAGRYVVRLTHSDHWIAKNHRALRLQCRFSNDIVFDDIKSESNLTYGENGYLFSYVGAGSKRHDSYRSTINIKVADQQSYALFDLISPTDRYVNIDEFKIYKHVAVEKTAMVDAMLNAQHIVKHNSEILKTEFILYADIDLNVVDGSSVWLSSMASLLCSIGRTVIISKREIENDLIIANIKNKDNLIIVDPSDCLVGDQTLNTLQSTALVRALDARLPRVRNLVVRGLDACLSLQNTRQFDKRCIVYLTDFYSILNDKLIIDSDAKNAVRNVLIHADKVIAQTESIANRLKQISVINPQISLVPPVIPDDLPKAKFETSEIIKIGYAGKINPLWGISELLDWAEKTRSDGVKIELYIVSNKISNNSGPTTIEGFADRIKDRMKRLGVNHFTTYNREQSMNLMAEMDFVWCWRPSELEDNTLELSTKLVEMLACGARCICYPSRINTETVGEKYPFFVEDQSGFHSVIQSKRMASPRIAEAIIKKHSFTSALNTLSHITNDVKSSKKTPNICVAGHDFKFIDSYISHLKSNGHSVIRDVWNWGSEDNLDATRLVQNWADIIFCEWGLANAVWHTQNALAGKRIFIRVHLQEINERARKFGPQIKIEAVEKIIFVSENVKREAMRLFNWPEDKLVVIPNYVNGDEYFFSERKNSPDSVINLGMVGIIPQRKRFDLALDTMKELIDRGREVRLHIKGPRPEELDYMHAPGRRDELVYYNALYKEIDDHSDLRENVIFSPWDNNVSLWYRNVDYILSPSDFESFHYALADGVLSGCYPVVWPWSEAEDLYTSDWIIENTKQAADRIEANLADNSTKKQEEYMVRRQLVLARYGHQAIFQRLSEQIGLSG